MPKQKKQSQSKGIVSIIFLIIFILFTALSFLFLPILISLPLFIIIFFPTLLFVTLGKLTKRWGLSFLVTSLVHIILLVAIGYWIYTDTTSLINNLQTQPKYLLYKEGNQILFGYSITDLDFQNLEKSPPKSLTKEQLESIVQSMDKKDKFIIIIKKDFFNKAPETLSLDMEGQKIELPKSAAFEILKSQNPEDIAMKYLISSNADNLNIPKEFQAMLKEGNIPEQFKEEIMKQANLPKDFAKIAVLGFLTMKIVEANGIEYLFESLQNNNLQVKPPYIVFWVIENIPFEQVKPYLPAEMQNIKIGN